MTNHEHVEMPTAMEYAAVAPSFAVPAVAPQIVTGKVNAILVGGPNGRKHQSALSTCAAADLAFAEPRKASARARKWPARNVLSSSVLPTNALLPIMKTGISAGPAGL